MISTKEFESLSHQATVYGNNLKLLSFAYVRQYRQYFEIVSGSG